MLTAELAGWLLVIVSMALMLWLALRAERRMQTRQANGNPMSVATMQRMLDNAEREMELRAQECKNQIAKQQSMIDLLIAQLADAQQRIHALELEIAQHDLSQGRRTVTAANTALRGVLEAQFSLDELRSLATDLDVDFDALPGEQKGAKARELVGWFERRGDVERLRVAVKAARPRARV